MAVVVPFHGDHTEAAELVKRLSGLLTLPGDQLLVGDNTPVAAAGSAATGSPVRVLPARFEQSPAHARNVAAAAATATWLLFVDADCDLPRGLIAAYFATPPAPGTGAVSGPVEHAERQSVFLARYARKRGDLDQLEHLEDPYAPRAVTANVMVRRDVFVRLGGFAEGARTGEDADFFFRMHRAGYGLELQPAATVHHAYLEKLTLFRRRVRLYAAGGAWLARRHPGSQARPRPVRRLTRDPVHAALALLRGDGEEAAFRMVDLQKSLDATWGYLRDNRTQVNTPTRAAERWTVATEFPPHIEPADGEGVVAIRRATRLDAEAWRRVRPHLLEDDAELTRFKAASRLALTRPRQVLADRGVGRQEPSWVALAPAVLAIRRSGAGSVQATPGDLQAERLAMRLRALA